MCKPLTVFLFFYLTTMLAHAGNIGYPVNTIPEALLKNANVVKRVDETFFEVVNPHETLLRKKYVFTILNEQGLSFATLVEGYNKMIKIESLEGNLYDGKGLLLKKMRNKDIRDYSAVSDISLMEDTRVKVFDFNYKEYPFTVEYEVITKTNNTYHFPSWTPQPSQYLSVENSSYTFICPQDYGLRFKAFNCNEPPAITIANNKKTHTWKAANLTAIVAPFAAPNWNEITTSVHFSAAGFEMEGYAGNAVSWEEFGKFQKQLNENRDQLPEAILQKIKQLTDGITNPKEKVKRLYEFMQQNTRYISIQLGIGGLQPFEARFVADKGYGDCKALSNYMYSLLKAAGIKSYHALVNGGINPIDRYMIEDLPSHQFNHMILCVPFEKDSMWLECTSQTDPAGYMGGFTGNRKVLLITEEGGKLVSTPKYGLKENVQVRSIKGRLDENGYLDMEVSTVYKAMQQDYVFGMLSVLAKDKIKEHLNSALGLASYEVNDFKYTAKKEVLPEVEEQLRITVNNYATVTGRRMFITPNVLNRYPYNLIEEERKLDIEFHDEYRTIDSVEIALTEGYEIESLPPLVRLQTSYGKYQTSLVVKNKKIFYIREFEQYSGKFPATEYAGVTNFYNSIYKADRSRLVLVKAP